MTTCKEKINRIYTEIAQTIRNSVHQLTTRTQRKTQSINIQQVFANYQRKIYQTQTNKDKQPYQQRVKRHFELLLTYLEMAKDSNHQANSKSIKVLFLGSHTFDKQKVINAINLNLIQNQSEMAQQISAKKYQLKKYNISGSFANNSWVWPNKQTVAYLSKLQNYRAIYICYSGKIKDIQKLFRLIFAITRQVRLIKLVQQENSKQTKNDLDALIEWKYDQSLTILQNETDCVKQSVITNSQYFTLHQATDLMQPLLQQQ